MAIALDPGNLKNSRVSILIPLAGLLALGAAQLCIGASPLVVALGVAGVLVSFIPLHLYGGEPYSFFALIFSVRYLLVGMILKTLYWQPLDTHLFNAADSYAATALLVTVTTLVVLIARKFDPKRDFLPFPTDPASLRRLAMATFSIGLVALLIIGSKSKSDGGGGNAGPLFVAAAAISGMAVLSLSAEAMRAVQLSNGKSLISPMLACMLGMLFLIVVMMNQRGFLLDCIIAVALVGFVYRAISAKLIVAGLIFVVFFSSFLSPLTLYLRSQKELPPAAFADVAMSTMGRMVVDSTFRKVLVDNVTLQKTLEDSDDADYDYFGDRSNIGNRLSFVALVDAVINGMRTREWIGYPVVEKSVSQVMPGFLGFQKEAVSTGDWLGWRVGLLAYPRTTYMVFGMPSEGYAAWGPVGLILYPIVFLLVALLAISRLCSLRMASPVAIFLIATLQTEIIESTSDGFMNLILRGLPMTFIALFAIYVVMFGGKQRRSRLQRARPSAHVTTSSVQI